MEEWKNGSLSMKGSYNITFSLPVFQTCYSSFLY